MIKAYVWENFFYRKISDKRNTELKLLGDSMTLWSFIFFFFWSTSAITTATMFIFYTQVLGHTLTA